MTGIVPSVDALAVATDRPCLAEARARLVDAATPIRAALAAIADVIDAARDAGDVAEVAYILRGVGALRDHLLRPLLDDVAEVEAHAEAATVAVMGDARAVDVPGVGSIQRVWKGGRTSWDGGRLLGRLGRSMVDPDTGEVVAAVPVDTLRVVLPQATAPSAPWKAPGLRSVGVDPADYRTVSDGRPGVRIIPDN